MPGKEKENKASPLLSSSMLWIQAALPPGGLFLLVSGCDTDTSCFYFPALVTCHFRPVKHQRQLLKDRKEAFLPKITEISQMHFCGDIIFAPGEIWGLGQKIIEEEHVCWIVGNRFWPGLACNQSKVKERKKKKQQRNDLFPSFVRLSAIMRFQ